MNNLNYSPSLISAVKIAKTMAAYEQYGSYGVPHLMIAILNEPTGLREIISGIGKDVDYIYEWFEVQKEKYSSEEKFEGEAQEDADVVKVLEEAERSKIKLGTDYIDALCVFTAVIRHGVVYSEHQITSLDISEDDVLNHFNAKQSLSITSATAEEQEFLTSSLFAVNMKSKKNIENGSLVLGREKEVRSMLENLQRSENKATLLVGDSGVGKTALINAFIKELSTNEDDLLQNTVVTGLNIPKLLASSTSENEISKKIVDVFEKLNSLSNQCVLVIDDLHILLESAGVKSNLITNILNAQLNDGVINLVLSITSDAYRKLIEKHPIKNKIEVVFIEELEYFTLIKCLERHKVKLEKYHTIKIADNVLPEIIHLSQRYFKESKMPYGCIDLLDRTIAAIKLSNSNALYEIKKIQESLVRIEKEETQDISELKLLFNLILRKISVVLTSKLTENYSIKDDDTTEQLLSVLKTMISELIQLGSNPITELTTNEIESVVAEITGIPIGKIQSEEKERLLSIEQKLQERVKGQNNAIRTLSDAIIESRSGLSNPKQPIGSFFFLGPTGTGKTELTKSLAELLFDDENAMIRFDMSEFKEEHSAALLYGAPPGYVGYEEGGMLVNKIRQKPYSVVLFDEIEKAHSSVYDVFLQIMDEGKIHDKLGREGDFSNSIIIFTSNIGSQWIAEEFEKGKIPTSNELIEVMTQYFRPEFLGRLTEVVSFAPITEQIAMEIFKLHFSRLQQQLFNQKNITLNIADEALLYLAQKGYSKKYGARPIAGVIRTYIKKVVSRLIVSEDIKNGDTVLLNYKDQNLVWEKC